MTKYLLLICTMATILISCDKENSCLDPEKLDGYHSLTSITCECPPMEVAPLNQQWKFDFERSKLDVFVACEDETNSIILDEGSYDFSIIDIKTTTGVENTIFKVDDREFHFTLLEDEIHLSDPGAELDAGSFYMFDKN